MVVECQPLSDQDSQNEALFQLARCAYAIFSGQIFRLHVFGVAICGSTATFVRFDRSGLLHSPDIDISTGEGADLFVQKMISLLVLPAKDFGYDPRYTFRRNDQRHLETLFAMDGHPPRVVSDLLCHRKCCRGRATLASCLAVATTDYQVPLSAAGSTSAQRFLDRDVVHKKIWRKEDRTGEGTTLERFRGVFAVCQVIDFQDEVYDTRLQYPNLLDQSPAASRFIPTVVPSSPTHTETSTYTTTSTTESNEGSDTKPIGELALIANDENTKTKPSQSEQPSNPTPECKDQDEPVPSPTYPPRETRFESDLLMPNGIMAFDEAGMLHRDISAYNILLINPEVHYRGTDRKWNNTVEGSLGNLVWKCLSSKPLPDVVSNATDTEIADSGRSWREEYIDGLSRGPYAVICDAEHAVKERRPLEEVHRDRTGTPTFVSAQLLLNPIGRAPVYRSFVHDLESLMRGNLPETFLYVT
ncbi:hypothetical protein FRC08_016630 [Ceratobasidium sp. 394]|nr:hypothetical protein FRC08_016630 [Ceratobasidium sp. 394]